MFATLFDMFDVDFERVAALMTVRSGEVWTAEDVRVFAAMARDPWVLLPRPGDDDNL